MTSPSSTDRKSLQQQLDEITARTRALVQPERLAGTERLIDEVRATGLESRMLQAGDTMPPFQLTGANGKLVRSSDLLALGPLVLKYFRGRWDPYDITELEAWQVLQPELRRHKALMVAISPQTPRQNAFTAEHHHLTFPILSDPHCHTAHTFHLAYPVPPTSQTYLKSMLVNLAFMNGDNGWTLPLPAIYVVDGAGQIIFSKAFADHRIRPEPDQVLKHLSAL